MYSLSTWVWLPLFQTLSFTVEQELGSVGLLTSFAFKLFASFKADKLMTILELGREDFKDLSFLFRPFLDSILAFSSPDFCREIVFLSVHLGCTFLDDDSSLQNTFELKLSK